MAASVDMENSVCHFYKSVPSVRCKGEFMPVTACRKDVMQHLNRCMASPRYHHVQVPEGLLLLFRSGLFYSTKESLAFNICEEHRNRLGTHWYRQCRSCCHPLHQQGKQKPDRGLTCTMSKEIYLHERKVVPVGSGICRKCYERHRDSYSTKLDIESEVVEYLTISQSLIELLTESQDSSCSTHTDGICSGRNNAYKDLFPSIPKKNKRHKCITTEDSHVVAGYLLRERHTQQNYDNYDDDEEKANEKTGKTTTNVLDVNTILKQLPR